MSRSYLIKTDFTAGELSPELRGRVDLRAHGSGAAALRNVLVRPTGGVTRRPGLRHLAELDGPARLIPFETARGDAFLLAFGEGTLTVFDPDGREVTRVGSIFGLAHLPKLTYARLGDALLLCHPDRPPQTLRHDETGGFVFEGWRFERAEDGASLEPFARFAPVGTVLTPQGVAGGYWLDSSVPVFSPEHLGSCLRLRGGELRVSEVSSPTRVLAQTIRPLDSVEPTALWEESAIGPARGYPRSVTVFQGRLVVGGTRDLPDRLWLSKSNRPFNFDLGTGLDDESVTLVLGGGDNPVIQSLHAGRALCAFADSGEWVVSGNPVAPRTVAVTRQTRIGIWAGWTLPHQDVDGAALFVGRDGDGVHEFVFADREQAWQATDLAALSKHLLNDPVDLAYDRRRRVLHVVNGDGTLASAAIDRNAGVTAWSRQETAGGFGGLAEMDGALYALVKRGLRFALERFEDGLNLDGATSVASAEPHAAWSGFARFVGETVSFVADGAALGENEVTSPTIGLAAPARELTVGYAYRHVIEALPGAPGVSGGAFAATYRPVRVLFQLLETVALTVDTGEGVRALRPDAPGPYSGELSLRTLGWRRGSAVPPWRIEQADPSPCTVLSVTTEVMVNA